MEEERVRSHMTKINKKPSPVYVHCSLCVDRHRDEQRSNDAAVTHTCTHDFKSVKLWKLWIFSVNSIDQTEVCVCVCV